ncbi:MAG: isochorismatase family protein [Oligoflexia bacterium]|nr:isochorismatase family protein [Oligoflexia bacterium]
MSKASTQPAKTLLTPTNHALIMIDYQPQMAFATRSIDIAALRNNAALVANAAKEFKVATILTAVASKTFSGPTFSEITDAHPNAQIVERTTMNCWEDSNLINSVNQLNKPKIVLAGLWTSVCIADPALSAIEQGFEVYALADACGDVSEEAHSRAMERMTDVGVRPLTSITYLLELQRDWARTETYNQVMDVVSRYGGGYGLGVKYAKAMIHGEVGKTKAA